MPAKLKKSAGHSWDVFFVYFDGDDDSLSVTGCWTPEEAIAQARDELNAFAKGDGEKNQFEIVAVIRTDAEI